MKDWEIIADNLKKAGWSLGWLSAIDPEGRTIWIADAHRGTLDERMRRSVPFELTQSVASTNSDSASYSRKQAGRPGFFSTCLHRV
jgi:hypothetical protein